MGDEHFEIILDCVSERDMSEIVYQGSEPSQDRRLAQPQLKVSVVAPVIEEARLRVWPVECSYDSIENLLCCLQSAKRVGKPGVLCARKTFKVMPSCFTWRRRWKAGESTIRRSSSLIRISPWMGSVIVFDMRRR